MATCGTITIEKAEVAISGPTDKADTTNDSGTVTFSAISIGDYDITASKSGYFQTSTSVAAGDFA
jgi:hypothetical protein